MELSGNAADEMCFEIEKVNDLTFTWRREEVEAERY